MALRKKSIIAIVVIAGLLIAGYGAYRVYRHYDYIYSQMEKKAPDPFEYKVTVPGTSGFLLTSPYTIFKWDYGKIVILDMKGNMILERNTKGVIYAFRQWKFNGHTWYSYIQYDKNTYHTKGALADGDVFILDSMLNIVKKVSLKDHGDISIAKKQDLDLHEFVMLGENHFITMAMYEKTVNNFPDSIKHNPNVVLSVPVLQETCNDTVVFQWEASNYPEFYSNSKVYNKYEDTSKPQDYMHMNSISIDPRDSNLVLSFRNLDQVIKVSRKTGDILWRLGGVNSDFPVTEEQKFLRQHDAKFIDSSNTLILLDNGDSLLRTKSRILEFQLDEANKKIVSFKAFNIPEEYSQYMGNVEKHGDYYYIGGGSGKFILVINFKTGEKKFELKSSQSFYRVQWVDNIGCLNNVIKVKRGKKD